jgi:hypothetical protein
MGQTNTQYFADAETVNTTNVHSDSVQIQFKNCETINTTLTQLARCLGLTEK